MPKPTGAPVSADTVLMFWDFFPMVWPIVGWLIVRSLILGYTSLHTGGSVRLWTGLAAGTDFLLAILLIAGLSIAAVVVSVFGPTPPLIASFAWVLTASFVATGLLLMEVANCEHDAVSRGAGSG